MPVLATAYLINKAFEGCRVLSNSLTEFLLFLHGLGR